MVLEPVAPPRREVAVPRAAAVVQVSAGRAPEAAPQGAASVALPVAEQAGSVEGHRAVREEAREVVPAAVVQVAAVGPSAIAVARVAAGRPAGAGAT